MSQVSELDTSASPSAGKADDRASFVLLCAGELRNRYAQAVSAARSRTRLVHSIEGLLGECLQRPPLAVLLDMNAMTRLGAMATAPLFELDVDWPILRCTLQPDGGANFMSVDPLRFGSLGEALDEIASGDPGWRREGRLRKSLRLNVACRLAIRRDHREPWLPANCLNISVGGLFAVTYESFVPGERVEIQLRDLTDTPLSLAGRIVRVRPWEAGTRLPGIALAFLPETVTDDFKRLLARPEMVQSLIRGCRKPQLPSERVFDDLADDRPDDPALPAAVPSIDESLLASALQSPLVSAQ